MTRAVWDKTAERFYETGVRMVMLFRQDANGNYTTGVPWSGVTGITHSPTGGEPNKKYADDIPYLVLRGVEEEEGTIEAFYCPDEFYECDGSASLSKGLYVHQQPRKPFGLCYRTVYGNDTAFDEYGYKLHFVYGATASPSEKSYETENDSPEPNTLSWNYTTTPVDVIGHKGTASAEIISVEADSTKLELIETIVYGGENNDPRLPLPDELAAILNGTQTTITPPTPGH